VRSHLVLGIAVIAATVLLGTFALANDPIKWSAPMGHYPNQWVPTPAPPTYNNPYGYRYPYYGYGYGPQDYYGHGAWGQAGYAPGNQSAVQQQYPGRPQYSGNPYNYYGR
jgi:hypothetical protein